MSRKYEVTAIVKDKHGMVISRGINSYVKTHPLQAKLAKRANRPLAIFLHAECDAIIKAGHKIKDAYTIEVYRFDRDGKPKLAKPCPICMSLIKTTPIRRIIYTEEEND